MSCLLCRPTDTVPIHTLTHEVSMTSATSYGWKRPMLCYYLYTARVYCSTHHKVITSLSNRVKYLQTRRPKGIVHASKVNQHTSATLSQKDKSYMID